MNRFFNILDKNKKYKKYFWVILLIGFVIYFPTFFNGFVWDDIDFIIKNPEMKQLNIPSLLGSNMFNSGPFYRPIPAIYFAILYSQFGQNAFYYHIIQLFLHVIATSLLFIFFIRFFSLGISFFLACVFLVHPINVESVAFIGSTQSELYFIPGITAVLLSQKKHLSRTRFLWIVGLLALSVFTKETGALFFLLVIIYRYLFKLGKIRNFLASGAVLAILYFSTRVFIGGATYSMSPEIPITFLSFLERLLNIPAIFIYYLKTFIFPLSLGVFQIWAIKTITFDNFFIPLTASGVFFLFIIYMALFLRKKASKQAALSIGQFQDKNERKKHITSVDYEWERFNSLLFFLFWLVFGMGILLHLIPLDMTVADRWFYFPIVGLIGIIGVVLQSFLDSFKHNKKLIIFAVVIIIIFLSLRTFIRTFDYKDNLTLYAHDLKEQNDNYLLFVNYAFELHDAGKIEEAISYSKKSVELYPAIVNLNNLGSLYFINKQYEEALETFDRAIVLLKTRYDPKEYELHKPLYVNKAKLLWAMDRRKETAVFIKNVALKEFPDDPSLYLLLAQAEVNLDNYQGALKAAERAHALAPDNPSAAKLYLQLININN